AGPAGLVASAGQRNREPAWFFCSGVFCSGAREAGLVRGWPQRSASRLRHVRMTLRVLIRLTELEDSDVRLLAAHVGGHRRKHALERMRSQPRRVLGQRIQELDGRLIDQTAEKRRAPRLAEGVRDDLCEAGSDGGPPAALRLPKRRRMRDEGDRAAGQRGWNSVVAPDADDLLDEIVLRREVAAKARNGHGEVGALRLHREAEPGENLTGLGRRG